MIDYFAAVFWEQVQSGLFFDELMHGVIGIPFAFFLWHKTKSVKHVGLFFLVLYLIDLDHLVDYWVYSGINFDVREFFGMNFFRQSGRLYLPLHGWEWVVLGFIFVVRRKGWEFWGSALVLALLAHLVWDFHNFYSIKIYLIGYRALMGFKVI